MVRTARIVLPNIPLHVTQRGNRRKNIFKDDVDRKTYKMLMKKIFRFHEVEILAYCLMTNHIHSIPQPRNKKDLSDAMRELQSEYSLYFNRKYGLVGHLWQQRFHSTVLDEEHLWHAVRYVELNPVKAGMVTKAELYDWSSAKGHCGMLLDDLITSSFPPPGKVNNWSQWLGSGENTTISELIKRNSKTGRICGSNDFIQDAESFTGLSLLPQKRGPKFKNKRIIKLSDT